MAEREALKNPGVSAGIPRAASAIRHGKRGGNMKIRSVVLYVGIAMLFSLYLRIASVRTLLMVIIFAFALQSDRFICSDLRFAYSHFAYLCSLPAIIGWLVQAFRLQLRVLPDRKRNKYAVILLCLLFRLARFVVHYSASGLDDSQVLWYYLIRFAIGTLACCISSLAILGWCVPARRFKMHALPDREGWIIMRWPSCLY